MSSPVKFWLVIGVLVALFFLALWSWDTPSTGSPDQERQSAVPEEAQGLEKAQALQEPERTASVAADPAADDLLLNAQLQELAREGGAIPIEGEMARWADEYREHLAHVAEALQSFEASAEPGREACNRLLSATYSAQNEVAVAPDPDVQENLVRALEGFREAGMACLQRNAAMQDTWLLLGRSAITLVEHVLLDRYGEAGVGGVLAEPMEGGSDIGRRAVEHWSN